MADCGFSAEAFRVGLGMLHGTEALHGSTFLLAYVVSIYPSMKWVNKDRNVGADRCAID